MNVSGPMLAIVAAILLTGRSQESSECRVDENRIRWIRPFKAALKSARESRRLVFTKPILGGSNAPKPGGRVAGGKDDCEGSW